MSTTKETTVRPSSPPTGVDDATWERYRSALEGLVSEMVPAHPGEEGGVASAPSSEEMRKLVTEAVSAVLLESDLLEKLVGRILRNLLRSGDGGVASEFLPKDSIRELCLEALRSFSFQTFGPMLKKEIKETVQRKLTEFGNTEEFKQILDSRFRVMEKYLRSDVIPSVVKQLADG